MFHQIIIIIQEIVIKIQETKVKIIFLIEMALLSFKDLNSR